MLILCLGMNHTTAGLTLRERLTFTEDQAKEALAEVRDREWNTLKELAILSTCNRVELYAASEHAGFDALEEFLSRKQAVERQDVHSRLYRYADEAAVEHLFRVAGGLDSLVVGEHQILGQVAAAQELAVQAQTAGPVLSGLFQAAVRCGKRVRSETAIGQNPASIASAAVHLAAQTVPGIRGARVGVLGAGEMAERVVEAVRKRGGRHIWVVNRSLRRARALAERWDGKADGLDALPEMLRRVDILITSTGAPETLLHTVQVQACLAERQGRPLVIIDIALPRDVEAGVGQLPGVQLFNLDQLQEHLDDYLKRRLQEVPRVEAIIAEEMRYYVEYLRTMEVNPIIAELRQRAEAIRQAELEKTLRRLPELTDEERRHVEALTQALVKKLLHEPTTRLRSEAGAGRAPAAAAAARRLFGLNGNSGAHSDEALPTGR